MHRIAQPGDEARLDAFLAQRPASAMFLRSNLAAHGLSGAGHDHATTYHLWEKDGQIVGVFGITQNQNTMVQFPDDALHDQICADLPRVLAGQPIAVMIGLSSEAQMALDALGLSDPDLYKLNHDEPLFEVALTGFQDELSNLRRPEARDFDLLNTWFNGYFKDTGLESDPAKRTAEALTRAERAIRGEDIWLLCDRLGLPLAMAGLNARIPDTVQVGGVYVPIQNRNRGLGRAVVAKILSHEASQGTKRAILFSNNDAASRAYEAIGFEQIGTFRVAILKEPACL
ncbi:Predicted acetyltransferase, GNAT family [Thalassococcus halodurans]|uniref:Predicted acetyltransferase, GNAT family n=1 Tax=Thalassococcus halodurans TaxID=373675 RepID=A0A1H5YL01_9RHOB|nr:GNAT family N-acetyltransferase [Thalassococcus halodurans]SEG24187.1 Predicted acetyltransferase, GNAT family [Thalassococcus halodurans]